MKKIALFHCFDENFFDCANRLRSEYIPSRRDCKNKRTLKFWINVSAVEQTYFYDLKSNFVGTIPIKLEMLLWLRSIKTNIFKLYNFKTTRYFRLLRIS